MENFEELQELISTKNRNLPNLEQIPRSEFRNNMRLSNLSEFAIETEEEYGIIQNTLFDIVRSRLKTAEMRLEQYEIIKYDIGGI